MKLGNEFETVAVGQAEIEQHQVRSSHPQFAKQRAGVGRLAHIMPGPNQGPRNKRPNRWFVVDDHDVADHAASSSNAFAGKRIEKRAPRSSSRLSALTPSCIACANPFHDR